MGFSTIAANMILLFTMVIIAFGLMSTMNENFATAKVSYDTSLSLMQEKIKEDITVSSISFSALEERISLDLTNSGDTRIDFESLELYVDSQRIPRSIQNRTITLDSSTDTINPGLWDPSEKVNIIIFMNVTTGLHLVEVFTPLSNKAAAQFFT